MRQLPPLLLLFGLVSCPRHTDIHILRTLLDDVFRTSTEPTSYEDEDYDYNAYGLEDKEDESGVYRWNVDEFPHPINTPRFCNRFKASRVCDPDSVLDKKEADVLDESIEKLYRETPCICQTCGDGDGGIVVGIALLRHMYRPYNVHPAKVLRSFAETLRFRWKLGKCDNDILIVVVTTDRLSYTDVGEATSRYLSKNEAHRIYLENKSRFSASNYSQGLMDILEGYQRATRTMASSLSNKKKRDGEEVSMALVAGVIVGVGLLLALLLFAAILLYRRYRQDKDAVDDAEEAVPDRGSIVSSSWSKKDIKVIFAPDKKSSPSKGNARYQKCETDEEETKDYDDEEAMDLTLATLDDTSFQDTTKVTTIAEEESSSEILEKDLTDAAEGIARTFPSKNGGSDFQVTDM